MHVCVRERRLYTGNLRKSELTDRLAIAVSEDVHRNPADRVANEIKCDVCRTFALNCNLQVLQLKPDKRFSQFLCCIISSLG